MASNQWLQISRVSTKINKRKGKQMIEKILITCDAARTIITDARNFTVETGGILVGTLTSPITIIAAGSSGQDSIHLAAQYTSDSTADKACLARARQEYGNGIVTVGWWHKHPSGFDRPSSGDCHQVQILKDEYNDGKPILMGIVNQRPGLISRKISLHLYSLDSAGNLSEHTWKLISGKNVELHDAISKATINTQTIDIDFWEDSSFQFYLNPVGKKRILHDIEALKKAGWQTKTSRLKEDHAMVLDISNGSYELRFVLPPEYPLNPPTVLTADGNRFKELELLTLWNSRHLLADLAAEASSVISCRCCKRRLMSTIANNHQQHVRGIRQ